MPLQSARTVWDINEVAFPGYPENILFGDVSPTPPVNGGTMYRNVQSGEWTEAWSNRESARAAAQKLKPMETYYDDEPGAGDQSSTFYDGLSGLLNNGVDLASKVAGIATAFRGGSASPDAQRTLAEVKKQEDTKSNKTLWLIGGIGAAVLVVVFFVLRRK